MQKVSTLWACCMQSSCVCWCCVYHLWNTMKHQETKVSKAYDLAAAEGHMSCTTPHFKLQSLLLHSCTLCWLKWHNCCIHYCAYCYIHCWIQCYAYCHIHFCIQSYLPCLHTILHILLHTLLLIRSATILQEHAKGLEIYLQHLGQQSAFQKGIEQAFGKEPQQAIPKFIPQDTLPQKPRVPIPGQELQLSFPELLCYCYSSLHVAGASTSDSLLRLAAW